MRRYQILWPLLPRMIELKRAGCSIPEIAATLGLRPNQVKQALARWRRRQRSGAIPRPWGRPPGPVLTRKVEWDGDVVTVTEKKILPS